MKPGKNSIPVDLYNRAQKRLEEKSARQIFSPLNETQRLERELEIYRLALDIQREELQQSQRQLQKTIVHYNQLFEMAPAGYFTLSSSRKIIQANHAGAELLNSDVAQLEGKPIDQ